MLTLRQAYPPGEHFTVPALPDVAAVNQIGGLNIAADRLAIVDGQGYFIVSYLFIEIDAGLLSEDPWRPNTPHSDIAKPRPDTIIRPFKLIEGQPLLKGRIYSVLSFFFRCRTPLRRERTQQSFGRTAHHSGNTQPRDPVRPSVVERLQGAEKSMIGGSYEVS